MIKKLSTLIFNQFVKHNIISEDAQDVYTYGVEITISSLIRFILVTIIGIIFKSLMQAMIFYVIFVALRSMTDGYHASIYLKCNTIFSFISLFTLLFQPIYGFISILGICGISVFTNSVYTFGRCSLLIRNEIFNISDISTNKSLILLLTIIVTSFV